MNQSSIRLLVAAVDATVDGGNPAAQSNRIMKALYDEGALFIQSTWVPSYMCANLTKPTVGLRYHDVTLGPLPMKIAAMTAMDAARQVHLDPINRTVLLVGYGLEGSVWSFRQRITLVGGVIEMGVPLEGEGKGALYVLDKSEPGRIGATSSFCWGPPGGTWH